MKGKKKSASGTRSVLRIAFIGLSIFLLVLWAAPNPLTVLLLNSSAATVGQSVSVTCNLGTAGTYTMNWADGTVATGSTTTGSVTLYHAYSSPNTYVAFCEGYSTSDAFLGTGSTTITVQPAPVTSTYTTTYQTTSGSSTSTVTKTTSTVSSDTSTYSPVIDTVTTTLTTTESSTVTQSSTVTYSLTLTNSSNTITGSTVTTVLTQSGTTSTITLGTGHATGKTGSWYFIVLAVVFFIVGILI